MKDKIEPIPKTMEKFFGCSGALVKPSPESVRAVVGRVAKGKIVTLKQVRARLAEDFQVEAACPASTTKALQTLSQESEPTCYWRVVKNNGELFSQFPGGVEGHAIRLEEEGVKSDFSKKKPVAVDYELRLFDLA